MGIFEIILTVSIVSSIAVAISNKSSPNNERTKNNMPREENSRCGFYFFLGSLAFFLACILLCVLKTILRLGE